MNHNEPVYKYFYETITDLQNRLSVSSGLPERIHMTEGDMDRAVESVCNKLNATIPSGDRDEQATKLRYLAIPASTAPHFDESDEGNSSPSM